MQWNGRRAVRKGMATGIWLVVAVGIAALAPSGSNADPPAEVEVADAVATTPAEPESAGPRPMIRFKNAKVRVNNGGIVERRMGAQGTDREKIRHHGVYSSQHAQPDISGRIRYSGNATGRPARHHTRGRIRYDGVTRAPDRARNATIHYDGVTRAPDRSRNATIREHWMGADRPNTRFGVTAD